MERTGPGAKEEEHCKTVSQVDVVSCKMRDDNQEKLKGAHLCWGKNIPQEWNNRSVQGEEGATE